MFIVNPTETEKLNSLTASEEAATFEVKNLNTVLPSQRYRSITTLPTLTGEFSEVFSPNFWGVWYSNAKQTDWARIRLATTEPNLTNGAALVDETDYIWPGSSGFHGAYSFIGTGRVDFGDILDQGASSSFTVQFRITKAATGQTGLASKIVDATDTTPGWRIDIDNSDNLIARITDGVTAVGVSTDILLFFDNVPHTYRMEVDRTAERVRVYIDDVLQATSSDTSAVGSLVNGEPMIFAEGVLSGGFDGTIDEVRFWSKILTPSELSENRELDVINPPNGLELYWRANGTNGIALDESGNGNNGTITNGTNINVDPVEFKSILDIQPHIHQNSTITNPAAISWFLIEFNFTGNLDGFVQAARLFIEVRDKLDHEASLGHNDLSRSSAETVLAAGGLDRMPGTWKKSRQFGIHLIESDYFEIVRPLLEERNYSKVVGIVFREDDTYPMDFIYYGYLDSGIVNSEPPGYRMTAAIVEP